MYFAIFRYTQKMLFIHRHLHVVLFLVVFCLTSCFWKEIEGRVTGKVVVEANSSTRVLPSSSPTVDKDWNTETISLSSQGSFLASRSLRLQPLKEDGQSSRQRSIVISQSLNQPPHPPSSPSDGQMPLFPTLPPGTVQPPGSPSSSSDGQLPLSPSSSSGGNLQPPPFLPSSSPSDGQMPLSPPLPPGAVQPPGSPSSSSDGQLPLPPSSSSGNPPCPPSLPSSSPSDGQIPLPPPSPPGAVQPPGSLSSSSDDQLPLPPSSSSGWNPQPPPFLPPSSPSDGQMPVSQPAPPGAVQPPRPPSSSVDGQLPLPPASSSCGNQTPPPPSGGGADAGGNLLTTTATTGFTTVPPPTGPPLDSFLLRSLRPKCSPDAVPTDDSLGPKWDEHIRLLIQRCIVSYTDFKKYSCKNRCGLEERDDSVPIWSNHLPRCFCDKFCDDFGDCCFDFDALCRRHVNPFKSPLTSNETCLVLKHGFIPGYISYAAWNTCPQNWTEGSVRQKCQDEDQNNIFRNLPVFDRDSHVTYKNIFCARCNGAVNTAYWTLKFSCAKWFNTTSFNFTSGMSLLHNNCSLKITPVDFQERYLKRCIPRFQDCSSIHQEKNESYCQTECLRYAFPVCFDTGRIRFGNLQCALCNGFKPSDLACDCLSGSRPGISSLTILFDFSSTSMSIKVHDRQQQVNKYDEQFWSCSSDEVYDPYAGSCKKIASPGSYNHWQNKHNETQAWDPNCTFIAFNESDYMQLPNGSVYLKLHNKTYSNTTYKIHDNRLLLCVNFSRHLNGTEKKRAIYKVKSTPASLRIITSIGCIVSMVSLVLLLITYILFAELRNLPGKIIINLALSLLLYQSVFFSAVKADNQDTCLAVAVLLHFFVLSSFTWMNVMAYDVHRIFTPTDGVAANRERSHKKRLMMYCLYAWGTPSVVVLVSATVDHFKKGSIGYGQIEDNCFISQPQAILYLLVLPVALLMLFNLFALGHIVFHIVKTRKETQRVTNQRQSTNIALICVKMASVMGVTWILGIAANVKALSFLWYPFVVLNSLQGMFIFLSFAVSGRALELYRSKITDILMNLTAETEENKPTSSNCTVQSTCNTSAGDYRDTQDTRL
ncbi:uncharacterized protein LOC144657232 isoform X1 [Oculina patagonica]